MESTKALCYEYYPTFSGSVHSWQILELNVVLMLILAQEVIKLFSCSNRLSVKFSLLINMKMPTVELILAFSY